MGRHRRMSYSATALNSLTHVPKHPAGRIATGWWVRHEYYSPPLRLPLFAIMPQARDYSTSNMALGRIGLPNDVAGVIAFFCEPAASFISGAIINIDGGYHL